MDKMERIMTTYTDSLILFILCASLYPAAYPEPQHITGIVLLIAVYCFALAVTGIFQRLFLASLAMLLCLVRPELSVFLPLFCYIPVYSGQYRLILPLLPPALIYLYHHRIHHNLFLLFLLLLSVYLARAHLAKKQLKRAVYSLRDDSTEKEMLLREKKQRLLESQDDQIYIATLKERNRIAREIHDNVGHMLSRSILQVGALLAVSGEQALTPHLETLKNTLNLAMDNIRNSVHDLHDESIDLPHAIKEITDNFSFCPADLSCDISSHVPKNIKYCLLAIVKEALNNTMRHSNATHVSVTVNEHPAFYQLLIVDNGTGVSSRNTPDTEKRKGIGITNMQERVNALHGILHISTSQGFRIFVSIPKTSE